jgi:hypothetical protein
VSAAGRRTATRSHKPWTARELELLRFMWGEKSLAWVAGRLGRSQFGAYEKAKQLGLPAIPQGYETFTEACRRTGYEGAQLRQILAWSRTALTPAFAIPKGPRKYRHHMIEISDVDAAVAEWLKTETVQSAGKRHAVCGATIIKRLKEAGILPVKSPATRAPRGTGKRAQATHWRVESSVVDGVMARHWEASRATETLRAAARRHGVRPTTLGGWLRAAGVEHSGYHWRSLDPAVVDRVVADKRTHVRCRAWKRKRPETFCIGGASKTLAQWCAHYHVVSTVVAGLRLYRGWSIERAVAVPARMVRRWRKEAA